MIRTSESEDRLRTTVERLDVRIAEQQRRLSNGDVPTERLPAVMAGVGEAYDALARSHALLGEAEPARAAYADAAVYYLSGIRESRKRRGMLRPRERVDDPRTYVHALGRALLARDDALVECVALETLGTGEPRLAEHDTAAYYAAKLLAAIALDDDRWRRFADEYRHAIRTDADPTGEFRILAYEGIAERDHARAVEGLEGMLEGTGGFARGRDDAPGGKLDDWLAALCLLADRKGLEVTAEVPTVPAVLLPETSTSARVVTAEEPESEREREPWLPRIHRDPETGAYVLAARVEYPEDPPLAAADLPETEGGPLLSEEYVEAVVEHVAGSDDEDRREMAEDLSAAREEGTLRRRLVVVPGDRDRSEFRIDRSVFEAGIDDIEVRTG